MKECMCGFAWLQLKSELNTFPAYDMCMWQRWPENRAVVLMSVVLCGCIQASAVCLRAPVSESLSRLQRDQLQKFAQYLISELPQQVNTQTVKNNWVRERTYKLEKKYDPFLSPDPPNSSTAAGWAALFSVHCYKHRLWSSRCDK